MSFEKSNIWISKSKMNENSLKIEMDGKIYEAEVAAFESYDSVMFQDVQGGVLWLNQSKSGKGYYFYDEDIGYTIAKSTVVRVIQGEIKGGNFSRIVPDDGV